MNASIQVDRIGKVTEWEALKDRWDELAGGRPFRRWTWLRSWWDGYQNGHELYVLHVHQQGQTLGLVPWCLKRSVAHGRLLMWIGGGKACSDDMGLLCAAGRQRQVAQAVAGWLDRASGPNRWHMLDLDGIAPQDPSMEALREALGAGGHPVRVTEQESCWSIAIPATWDEYVRSLNKNARRIVRLLDRDYIQTGKSQYRVAKDLGQVRWGYDKIQQLHQQCWNARGVAGCFSRPEFDRFLWTAAARLHAEGHLHVAWVELEGKVVSGSLGMVFDQTHATYVAGMDIQQAACRPGWLMNLYHLRHAIDHHLTTLDFLRGDEVYKARLGAEPRPQVRWRAAATRPWAQVRYGAYWAGVAAHRWWRANPEPAAAESN